MLTAVEKIRVKPEEARRELARRELARRHLVEFSEYTLPWYKAARHHKLAATYLEQVLLYIQTEGKEGIGRLLLEEPPRHGKTKQVSHLFPAWALGKQPDMDIILTSYNADRANENSRAVREIVQGEKYRAIFGDLATVEWAVELSSDSRSVQAWDLAAPNRGGVTAAGVGGGLTGTGAHLMIVDDPIKNREEAESAATRDKLWEWWTSTAYTRLEKGGAVVGMFTRWNVDDWAGRILRMMATDPASDQWIVLCMPAFWEFPIIPEGKRFEEYQHDQLLGGIWVEDKDVLGREVGEALWPEKYNVEDLLRIQANIGEYDWQALYQQAPFSRQGTMFKREWFIIEDNPPEKIRRRVRYYDKAGTEGGGAYTAGPCMSLGEDGLIHVEHVARGQWESYRRDEEIVRIGKQDQQYRPGVTVIWHYQDPGSAGVDSAKATNAKLAMAGLEAHFEVVTGSKEVRAGPWSSALEAGLVRLVRGGWNEKYIEEHLAFPKGRYKDQVDGSSGAFSKLQEGVIDGKLFF